MSKTTTMQRAARVALDGMGEKPLRAAAHEAWADEVARQRELLAGLLQRNLGRSPEAFPAPLKGRDVAAEVEGELFAIFEGKNGWELAWVLECAACRELKRYPVKGYAELGRLMANAEIDPRCWDCVKEMRRAKEDA